MDNSMITYADSYDELDSIIVDDKCKEIYNDFSELYISTKNKPSEKDFFDRLTKYDKHYLVYYFLGYYYDHINNLNSAMACYKICISKYPLVDAFLNMAIIYQKCGKDDLTKSCLQKAYDTNKTDLRILNFLGAIYYLEKNFYLAIEHYKKIIKNNNKNSVSMKNIYNNIGFSCTAIGKCKQALQYFENGLQIPSQRTIENIKLDVQLLQNKLISYDYMYDNPSNVFDEFLRINDLLQPINICSRSISKIGKLKIGLVSPDFRQHVCAFFIEPILQYFDRTKIEIYCYANVNNEDKVSEKFKNFDDVKWFNIYKQEFNVVCDLIHSHQIDILIDLAGHTNGNRLDIFSQKPAPIQITYLGYPNGTGLINMDYRITDKFADPINTKQKFTEKLIYLPRCFICYSQTENLENIPVIPIKHNFITFGVMNKLNKHNKTTFKIWSEIIKNIPNSVLLIKRDMKSAFDIRVKYLKKLGLNDSQIKIVGYVKNQQDYYNLYNDIDICLDTFPYSGTTTSCDAFLMSTPIITLGIPDRHVSNVTKSMLFNMGFPELYSKSLNEYIEKAIKLANDPDKIIYYKSNIRQKFIELMNKKQFSKEFDELMLSLRN